VSPSAPSGLQITGTSFRSREGENVLGVLCMMYHTVYHGCSTYIIRNLYNMHAYALQLFSIAVLLVYTSIIHAHTSSPQLSHNHGFTCSHSPRSGPLGGVLNSDGFLFQPAGRALTRTLLRLASYIIETSQPLIYPISVPCPPCLE